MLFLLFDYSTDDILMIDQGKVIDILPFIIDDDIQWSTMIDRQVMSICCLMMMIPLCWYCSKICNSIYWYIIPFPIYSGIDDDEITGDIYCVVDDDELRGNTFPLMTNAWLFYSNIGILLWCVIPVLLLLLLYIDWYSNIHCRVFGILQKSGKWPHDTSNWWPNYCFW